MRHQLTFYNQTGIFIEVADGVDNDLEETVKYLNDVKIERMGDVLTIGERQVLRHLTGHIAARNP